MHWGGDNRFASPVSLHNPALVREAACWGQLLQRISVLLVMICFLLYEMPSSKLPFGNCFAFVNGTISGVHKYSGAFFIRCVAVLTKGTMTFVVNAFLKSRTCDLSGWTLRHWNALAACRMGAWFAALRYPVVCCLSSSQGPAGKAARAARADAGGLMGWSTPGAAGAASRGVYVTWDWWSDLASKKQFSPVCTSVGWLLGPGHLRLALVLGQSPLSSSGTESGSAVAHGALPRLNCAVDV